MKKQLMIGSVFLATTLLVLLVAHRSNASKITPVTQPITLPATVDLPHNISTITRPQIELVFALDTTASMQGLIDGAKEKIWSIASTMAATKPSPEIRIGLVAYRDRGDAYITQTHDLSNDLDSIYAELLDFSAAGGGDGPESVNAALYQAVNSMSWNQDPNSYKAIFLVGDAPGHHDYQDDIPFASSIAQAKRKGIVVNTIQAGNAADTQKEWTLIARLGLGDNFQVEQDGSALAIVTPFDRAIADASRELDATRLYFGDKAQRELQLRKRQVTSKLHTESSDASMARRAKFNLSESGIENFIGEGELVSAIENNAIRLEEIKTEDLPETLQSMPKREQALTLKNTAEKRKKIASHISELNQKRDAYIETQMASRDDVDDSLDQKLYRTLIRQAKDKGLQYDEKDASY